MSNLNTADRLNNLERLILAQAVYELGSNAWAAVSDILSQHPLIINRDDLAFSPNACQSIYSHLLESFGLDSAEPEKLPRNTHSNNLKLAQRMYQARVLELKQLILAEEARFRSVAAEIEAIRAGKWDVQIEKHLGISEDVSDKTTHLSQSERADALAESESDLTHISDPSPSVSQAKVGQPLLEEETIQELPDEDLTSSNSPPHLPSPPSIHEGDAEILASPHLSSPPSPVDIDGQRELSPSFQLPTGSPDPLDIIASGENVVESDPPKRHESIQPLQTPTSFPPSPESSDPAASSEHKQLDVAGPTEIAEVQAPDLLEHLGPSAILDHSEASTEMEPDEPAGSPTSHPLEDKDKTSTMNSSPISAKEDVSSKRSRSEPCETIQSAELPSPLEDGAEALGAGIPRIATDVSEPQELSEVLEVKEETGLDDDQPVETQLRQDDVMEVEVEQVDGLQVASPITEQSRHDHKRKVSEAASIFSDSTRDRKKVREDSQPVDEDEPGPVRRRGRPPAADSQTSKKFQTVIIMVHSQISQHRNGNIFHNPIKKSEAPDYYDIVKRPVDLKTIKARIREGQIASSAEFQRDVYLMFANSLMYNRPGSDIYTMAEEMMLESEAQINTFRQTEGIIKGSHR